MLLGAALIPSAPLLLHAVAPNPPDGVADVRAAVDEVLARLPQADVAVLVGPGPRGLHDVAHADLSGLGRGDVVVRCDVDPAALRAVSRVVQYPRVHDDALPLGLAVLALLVGGRMPLLPVAVPATTDFDALVATGAGMVQGLTSGGVDAVLIAAADASAGLTERSPLHLVPGAREYDDQVCDLIDTGRLDGLGKLGPAEAARVGAVGWASTSVALGACARAKLGLVVRHYSAPRGVGYLVAHGG